MQRSATRTGPGMPRSPFSQRRTVRKSLSSAAAAACWVVNPAASRAALNSSGVMANDQHLAATAMRAASLGNQNAVKERAVRILDGHRAQVGGQFACGNEVDGAGLPHFPAHAPVHLDNDVRHVSLRSDEWSMGPMALCVNGENA